MAAFLLLWIAGCSEMKFLVDDFQAEEPQPLTMEDFVLHHYEDDREVMRVQSKMAQFEQDTVTNQQTRINMTDVEVFFYDQKTTPYEQTARLSSDRAILHLIDDPTSNTSLYFDEISSATAPARRGDIDFKGNMVLVDRTQKAILDSPSGRFIRLRKTLLSNKPSHYFYILSDQVYGTPEPVTGGFELDMATQMPILYGGMERSLTEEESATAQAKIQNLLGSIPWSAGPDDIPVQTKEEKQS